MADLGVTQDSYSPTELFIPGLFALTIPVTIKTGAGVVAKNTVLGKELIGAAASAVIAGGNTGNGTLTLDATTPKLVNVQAGVYAVRCTAAASDSGTFRISDPKGNVLGDVAVGATFANQIKFAIADGSTDFEVGDGFDITVAAGSGKYLPYDADNIDGSQIADAILTEDVDATSADVATSAYAHGFFNNAALTGFDAAAADPLRLRGIYTASIM